MFASCKQDESGDQGAAQLIKPGHCRSPAAFALLR